MTVEGRITEFEFVKLNRYMFFRRPAIALLIIAAMGVGLFYTTRSGLGSARVWLVVSPMIIPLGLYVMVGHRSLQRYRRSPTLQARVRYTLTDDGVDMEAAHGTRRIPWGEVEGITELPSHILLYGPGGQAFLVSRGWFSDPAQADRFVETVRSRRG